MTIVEALKQAKFSVRRKSWTIKFPATVNYIAMIQDGALYYVDYFRG